MKGSKKGLDICCQQGDIDWGKVKASGIDFVIPRCGRGITLDDNGMDWNFLEYVQGAQSVGISVPGVYHFIYVHCMEDALRNAKKAVEIVKRAGLPKSTIIWCDQEEPTVIDAVEHGFNLTTDLQRKVTEIFCNYVLAEGYCTGVYLNHDYLHRVYGTDITQEYDIWYEDHTNAEPGFPCLMRQTDWQGRCPGIGTNVDKDDWVGIYTAGTAKPQEDKGGDKGMFAYTEKELVEVLIKLASGNPGSDYVNYSPYNLLYWSGSRWSADCHNLYKALFNGRSIVNPAPGSFQSDLSATGDCTERQLMNQCTQRSNNFKALGDKFRCLYMDGHFGGYLGFEMEVPGQGIINCVEATPRWEDGIQYSYVDENGGRRWAKDRPIDGGYWTEHGLATKWIDYSDGADPQPSPEPAHKNMSTDVFVGFLPELKSGSVNGFVGLLQKCLRYTGDYTAAIDDSFGPGTTQAVKAYQQRCGLYVDGIVGQKTWTSLIG